jgi:hypothetical protein
MAPTVMREAIRIFFMGSSREKGLKRGKFISLLT